MTPSYALLYKTSLKLFINSVLHYYNFRIYILYNVHILLLFFQTLYFLVGVSWQSTLGFQTGTREQIHF